MIISHSNKYLKQLFIAVMLLFFMIFIEYECQMSINDKIYRSFDDMNLKIISIKDNIYVNYAISKSHIWEIENKQNMIYSYLNIEGATIESLQQQNKYVDSIINSHQL